MKTEALDRMYNYLIKMPCNKEVDIKTDEAFDAITFLFETYAIPFCELTNRGNTIVKRELPIIFNIPFERQQEKSLFSEKNFYN